jgi:hypothetical protein
MKPPVLFLSSMNRTNGAIVEPYLWSRVVTHPVQQQIQPAKPANHERSFRRPPTRTPFHAFSDTPLHPETANSLCFIFDSLKLAVLSWFPVGGQIDLYVGM